MTIDRPPVSSTTTRQKIIVGAFLLILIVIIWQIYGLLKGPQEPPAKAVTNTTTTTNARTATHTISPMMPQQAVPQPAMLPKEPAPAMSQHEADMLRVQQQNEARYISTLNELQILRLERDIAETNKAIMSAKLDIVKAETNIVSLLQPPPPPVTPITYAKNLVTPVGSAAQLVPPTSPPPTQAITPPASADILNYTVISVSQIRGQWSAVIGFQGNLYSVNVGDILPPDGSKIISITRSGIVLQKHNVRKKVSLVPII